MAAIYRLALVGVELGLNILAFKLGIAIFAHADGRKGLFYDPQFSLGHVQSLAHREGWA